MREEEQYRRLEAIFAAMEEATAQEREAVLQKACQGDTKLESEARQFLEMTAAAGPFLQEGIRHARASFEDSPPERAGPYKLVWRLGTGGMGEVWKGVRDDGQFEQVAAVKVIRRGMDTEGVVARFLAERRILALLEHPNIARLLDGGVLQDGRPYLVMEYVDGDPLLEYCRGQRLSLKDRLRLIVSVCEAVQAAHSRLIVHCDLKPSNILVTQEGTAKLLDFGIAKVLGPEADAQATIASGRALTPDYASPEQVRSEPATTATDVYGLGTVLYELLTGAKAHHLTDSSWSEIERVVCDQEPRRPSSITREVPAELDAIVMKALRKQPKDRYVSAVQLGEDLQRFLSGRPVIAKGDAWSYRSVKFLGRHRWGAAAAAALVVTMAAGTLLTLREKHRAERRFSDARSLARTFIFDLNDAIEMVPGATKARHLLASQALAYLDRLAEDPSADAELRGELAAAYDRVGLTYYARGRSDLGDVKKAYESHAKAETLREDLLRRKPDDVSLREQSARSQERLYHAAQMMEDRLAMAKHVAICRQLYEGLAKQFPEKLDYGPRLALVRMLAGELLQREGKPDEAMRAFQEAIALGEKLAAGKPKEDTAWARVGVVYSLAGDLARDEGVGGGVEKAVELHAKALDLFESNLRRYPDEAQTRRNAGLVRRQYGESLLAFGKTSEAQKQFEEFRWIAESLRKVDPNDHSAPLDLAAAHYWIGRAAQQEGRWDQAEAAWRRSRGLFEEIAGRDQDNVHKMMGQADTETSLAESAWRREDREEAIRCWRRALERWELAQRRIPEDRRVKREIAKLRSRLTEACVEQASGLPTGIPAGQDCRPETGQR